MTTLSLWWDTLPADLSAPLGAPLPGDREADIAIVGAGYTGLWTAYWLQRHDPHLRIAIIEANVAGFGASGRNGGWASTLFPVSLTTLARASSRDAAVRQYRTMGWALDSLGDVVQAERWSVDWQRGGSVIAARTPLQLDGMRQEVAERRGYGLDDVHLLGRDETLAHLGATDVVGGTFTPDCAALHPARLVRSLARTVVQRGAALYEGTAATAVEPGVVRTTRGVVRAPIVVRATEGYTSSLAGHARTLAPIYSLMIATAPLSPQQWQEIGLAQRETFTDGRHLIIYGQRTADGRIAFGGRGAPYHFGSRITAEQDRDPAVHAALWHTLLDMLPALSGTAVTHAWGGPLGIARDWWASCGFDRRTGMAWAGGYVGDGVTTSHLAGRTLADLITGTSSDLTDLPWVDHRSRAWEPEPARWIGANLAVRAMTRADAYEERTGRPSRIAAAMSRLTGG